MNQTDTKWTETEAVGVVKALIGRGAFFKAYDTATNALFDFPNNPTLKHRALLALANAGAYPLAMQKFAEMGLVESNDLDVMCLLARLNKDRGFASIGDSAISEFRTALSLYEAAWQVHQHTAEAYYPAINAAACAVLSGDKLKSAHWAQWVLEHLTSAETSESNYWTLATRIEALVILGKVQEAAHLVPLGLRLADKDLTSIASTTRQLKRLCDVLQLDFEQLGFESPSTVLHYTGHLVSESGRFPAHREAEVRQAIDEHLQRMRVGTAYGSLAGGADLIFAEALLEHGADLHVILPFNIQEFVEVSVARCGMSWIDRFNRCLQSATSVRMATEDSYLSDEQLFTYCSQIAMGLALLNARHLNAPAVQIGVWDGCAHDALVGTEADLRIWSATGNSQLIVPSTEGAFHAQALQDWVESSSRTHAGRANKAMLFADVKGFSKLNDAALPGFIKHIMGTLATVTHAHKDHLHSINTWGDGIFAVFNDVSEAAECALRMQEALALVDCNTAGLPAGLALRVGLHLGPVYSTVDPITQRTTAIGAHVSRAARIEPITPEGCVYVTETFAAVLALQSRNRFACDYVGLTETAKNYGVMRMFLLRRTGNSSATTVVVNFER